MASSVPHRVQSVAFPKSAWTAGQAREWLKGHGFRFGSVDDTGNFVRFRQHDPEGYASFGSLPQETDFRGKVRPFSFVIGGTKAEIGKAARANPAKKAAYKPGDWLVVSTPEGRKTVRLIEPYTDETLRVWFPDSNDVDHVGVRNVIRKGRAPRSNPSRRSTKAKREEWRGEAGRLGYTDAPAHVRGMRGQFASHDLYGGRDSGPLFPGAYEIPDRDRGRTDWLAKAERSDRRKTAAKRLLETMEQPSPRLPNGHKPGCACCPCGKVKPGTRRKANTAPDFRAVTQEAFACPAPLGTGPCSVGFVAPEGWHAKTLGTHVDAHIMAAWTALRPPAGKGAKEIRANPPRNGNVVRKVGEGWVIEKDGLLTETHPYKRGAIKAAGKGAKVLTAANRKPLPKGKGAASREGRYVNPSNAWDEAAAYIRAIRNEDKRRYGQDQLAWLRRGGAGSEPARPPGLSYMGAQAVRIQLSAILSRSVSNPRRKSSSRPAGHKPACGCVVCAKGLTAKGCGRCGAYYFQRTCPSCALRKASRAARRSNMAITAKFPGWCGACRGPIAAGDRIEWAKGTPTRHVACGTAPLVATPQRAPAPSVTRRQSGTRTGCRCGSIEEYSRDSDCRQCKFDAE